MGLIKATPPAQISTYGPIPRPSLSPPSTSSPVPTVRRSAMLSVHRCDQPFLPTSSHATSMRRHQQAFLERGRSRNVSQAALARKKSEERRRRAVLADAPIIQAGPSTPRATSPRVSEQRASSIHKCAPVPDDDAVPVASSSSTRFPSPPSPSHRPTINTQQLDDASDVITQITQPSDSSRRHRVTGEPSSDNASEASSLFDEEDSSDSLDSFSLQDQMQQAYAACQTTCLPNPGKKHCRCRNMHRARVLYLKTQDIDVTSDDDPRIEQVRDEDFVFVPGGELVLDEESLAVLNEERKRREKEAEERKWRVRGQMWEAQAESTRAARVHAQRYNEEPRSSSHASEGLEFWAKRGQFRSSIPGQSKRCNDKPQTVSLHSPRMEPMSSCPDQQNEEIASAPCRVSFKEVIRSLHGSLFPGTELQRARSPTQNRLLDSLLESPTWQEGGRRREKIASKVYVDPRTQVGDQLWQPSASDDCIACSVSSDSTISRTNSWTSTTSDASSSTCITSPASSPILSKVQLPPLMDDRMLRKRLSHSCRVHRKSRPVIVALHESPLANIEGAIREQTNAKAVHRPSHEHKVEIVKSAIVTRVRQSVYGFVDFASRIQQSYMRTLQFAVSLQVEVSLLPPQDSTQSRRNDRAFKPIGYRANPTDVQQLSPYPVSSPMRDLNFPSEVNIPLGDLCPSHSESNSGSPARVFAPLAFVPPSPLRPRDPPAAPEWRLRPVANPCTLRLKAHAKCLSEKGIPWEGRAHIGSLGGGRERLTGVAFEGLGGSRLAFETK